MEAQTFSVKRAEVEFHNFASFGEPERALATYAEENVRRGALIRKHQAFIGALSPFLEIGANVGHTSYMLANEFGGDGFALDISADALRYGMVLQEQWKLKRAPVRVAGDAVNLPFRDGSLRCVFAFQTLSQFMDIERVFLEVKRVLAPGGVFVFSEEPLRRLLSLRLYNCAYYKNMKGWERRLYEWGLLGYLVSDVIGADQEESFGIRLNHGMGLNHWHDLVRKHFVAHEYEVCVPERGWGERVLKKAAVKLDPFGTEWRAARLLGGTLAAICRKDGGSTVDDSGSPEPGRMDRFETFLRCPDCKAGLGRRAAGLLWCPSCGYTASGEHGVYNLLTSAERSELYPGDREDIIDFSLPSHEVHLLGGFHELEGVYGNKFRWIGAHACVRLLRVKPGHQRLRIRGHAHENAFSLHQPVRIAATANGLHLGQKVLHRPGLFVFETNLPDACEYKIEITASPTWRAPGDNRDLTVNLSMIRLVPRE